MRPSIEIVKADINRIAKDFKLMSDEVPVVQSRVINRAVSAVNTEASIQVRNEYNLKAARVKKNFKIRKATKYNLNAGWYSTGKPIGLINFGARKNKKGISVKVRKDGSRTTVIGSFIQLGKNKVDHVFWREKKGGVLVGRYNVHRLEGPRIEDALVKPEVQKALQTKVDITIESRLKAEVNYILEKTKR